MGLRVGRAGQHQPRFGAVQTAGPHWRPQQTGMLPALPSWASSGLSQEQLALQSPQHKSKPSNTARKTLKMQEPVL